MNQITVSCGQNFATKMNLGNMTPAQYRRVHSLLHSFNHISLTNPTLDHPVLDGIVFSVSDSTNFLEVQGERTYNLMSCSFLISHTKAEHSKYIDLCIYLPTYKDTDELEAAISSAEAHMKEVIEYVLALPTLADL